MSSRGAEAGFWALKPSRDLCTVIMDLQLLAKQSTTDKEKEVSVIRRL